MRADDNCWEQQEKGKQLPFAISSTIISILESDLSTKRSSLNLVHTVYNIGYQSAKADERTDNKYHEQRKKG